MKMRVTAILLLAIVAAALTALAWRAWDPPAKRSDPATARLVNELHYQGCIQRAVAESSSRYDQLSGLVDDLLEECKAP